MSPLRAVTTVGHSILIRLVFSLTQMMAIAFKSFIGLRSPIPDQIARNKKRHTMIVII